MKAGITFAPIVNKCYTFLSTIQNDKNICKNSSSRNEAFIKMIDECGPPRKRKSFQAIIGIELIINLLNKRLNP